VSTLIRFILAGLVLAIHAIPCMAAALAAGPLRTVADVPLGGRTTRLDYESIDAGRHLLFIAHLGDSQIIVFDTARKHVVARIANVSLVHGVLAIPEVGRVYASATGRDEVLVIDETTFRIMAKVPVGDYPDGMAYAPGSHKLYVSNEHGNSLTVIDVRTNRAVATIAMGGEVGNTQYDPASGHVFSNVQTMDDLVEIDPVTDAVVSRIPLRGADGNHGLLIDPASRLAFIACEGNDTLLVLDMTSRRITGSFKVGGRPDVLAFDAASGYLYVASEAGLVSLYQVESTRVTKLGDVPVGHNAHVVAVDPVTHRSYFPLNDLDGRTAVRIMEPAR